MSVKKDDWLAESMGRPCYAVSFDEDFVNEGQTWIEKWRGEPSFVFAKVATDDATAIRLLQDGGFYLVDTAVTFEKKVTPESWDDAPEAASKRGHHIRLAQPDDIDGTIAVARNSFARSRFHLDPDVPDEVANELRARWVENFFKGKRGEAMLLACDGERVVGFNQLLLRDDAYIIDLIAVDAAYRKRGIASDLVRFGDHHFRDVSRVRVSTQVANVAACRLYERMGFVLSSAKYVFHLYS